MTVDDASAAPPRATHSEPILVAQGFSAGYGALRVIHDLDLAIYRGERIGVVGLNGHGKSSLLNGLMGLTGWQSGSVRLNGHEIGGQRSQGPGRTTHRIVRRGMTLVPQGDAIFPGLSVKQNLHSGAYTRGAWRSRRARTEQIVELFPRLAELMERQVGVLSGGERRMVSVGRALMTEAEVYLVDEPSIGLAPSIASNLVRRLLEVDVGAGAMVIAEQNVALLEGHVDRVLGMYAGELKGGTDVLFGLPATTR